MTDDTEVRDGLFYSKEHEWARIEGGLVVVGITDYAQHSLHEITYVELPEVGSDITAGDECGLIESMKASSEVFSPVSGTVIEVNTDLESSPEAVNESPYDDGWMFKVRPSNLDAELDSLMSAEEYRDYIDSL